ncbi:MAG: hypothetical protein AUH14_08980 [Candidatus Rokubacteria bacterium 13_2_20CM_69_15_1]|nr:MAG: hypothetical protein AUH14_08980 [Candidatus Rokubacteria bacterium 13_2_20CM_69_15_1]
MPYFIHAFGRGWPLALLVVLGCLALGADLGEGQQRDICGCTNNPSNLGDFDTANPASYPPGTVSAGNGFGGTNITIPLPADGVLIFRSFTGTRLPAVPGCCTFDTFVLFKRNAANSPATILVSGDVRIDSGAQLLVNGDDATAGSSGINGLGGLGGVGGFRGGDGAYQSVNLAADGGPGFGPGGGAPGTGSPALTGGGNATFFGVPELLPLVGAIGGGAVLIAANGTVTINGQIRTDGGAAGDTSNGGCAASGGTGSGGAIRLVANRLEGGGLVLARPGRRCLGCSDPDRGGSRGLIRLEAFTNTLGGDRTDPPASRALAPGPLTSPITTAVAITKINGQTVPIPPQGVFGVTDLVLPAPGTVPIDIRTTGVPGGTTVQVTVKPRVGGAAVSQNAALSACDSTGVCTTSTAFDLPPGEFLVEARATFQTP